MSNDKIEEIASDPKKFKILNLSAKALENTKGKGRNDL